MEIKTQSRISIVPTAELRWEVVEFKKKHTETECLTNKKLGRFDWGIHTSLKTNGMLCSIFLDERDLISTELNRALKTGTIFS